MNILFAKSGNEHSWSYAFVYLSLLTKCIIFEIKIILSHIDDSACGTVTTKAKSDTFKTSLHVSYLTAI